MLKRILKVITAFAMAGLMSFSIGCRSSYEMTSEGGLDEDRVAALNSRAEKDRATVLLLDGTQKDADALRIEGDAATWLEPESRQVASASVSHIVEISFTRRGAGAQKGVLIGVVAGGLAGVVLGYSDGDDPPANWSCGGESIICIPAPDRISLSAEVKATLTGLFYAGAGMLVGGVTGAIMGEKTVYRLQPRQPTNLLWPPGDNRSPVPADAASVPHAGESQQIAKHLKR
jgi:hypothetical protein